jgi:hypothetical protein
MIDERGAMSELLDGLWVFHGEATNALGRIYARLAVREDVAGWELTGRVVGPRCRWAKTLPAVSKLVEVKRGGDAGVLLAEAIVPDPCFWSDGVPMLYDVHVEMLRGGETVAVAERSIGFRGVGRRGRSLFRQGKRWVPRGMYVESVVAGERDDLEAWRAAPAVMVVDSPSDALCLAASEMGVWVVADLCDATTAKVDRTAGQASSGTPQASSGTRAVEVELARVGRHAAVFLAVLPEGVAATGSMRAAAPNLLLAERGASGGDCVWLNAADGASYGAEANASSLPVVAHRPVETAMGLAGARAACDLLQRDLAGIGDYAGYFI